MTVPEVERLILILLFVLIPFLVNFRGWGILSMITGYLKLKWIDGKRDETPETRAKYEKKFKIASGIVAGIPVSLLFAIFALVLYLLYLIWIEVH